ncbi:MAG TPA: transglutaminase-like domain-containing protein, partial [Flavisolibacter sp.]|nr:transglutaminase-like domain-containing protein [Flavisolibacter sp.]
MTRLLPLLALSFLLTTKLLSQTGVTDAKAAAIPEASCASVESLASYIKDNFTTDTTRIRAIYVWITHHISYDVARLKARELDPFPKPQAIADVLATRSAVCQGYSDLFAALCKAVGIDAVVVSGYTRKGNSISPISHAWVAAQLAGDWYLFDPT